jgi:hypothetical protein
VNAGDKVDYKITKDPNDKQFVNLRAKMFWKTAQWITAGGKLELLPDENENNSVWYELARLKYRTKLEGTQGKMQIMPKEMMLKEGIDSPDVADSLSLCFAGIDFIEDTEDKWEEEYEERRMAEKTGNPFNPFEIL